MPPLLKRAAAIDSSTIDLRQIKNKPQLRNVQTYSKKHCQVCNLSKICLKGSLNNEKMDALSEISKHPKPTQKGDYIYRQNDDFSSVYIVRSGSVKLYQVNQNGEEHIAGFYLPGEMFGMDGLLKGQHSYSARTLDTTAVCQIPFQKLEHSFTVQPGLSQSLLTVLCSEIHERQQPLLLLHNQYADKRLATFLIDIAGRISQRGLSDTEFELSMSRRDIANYLGITEETTSRLFTRFQKLQLISANRRQIKIKDPDGLKALSATLH